MIETALFSAPAPFVRLPHGTPEDFEQRKEEFIKSIFELTNPLIHCESKKPGSVIISSPSRRFIVTVNEGDVFRIDPNGSRMMAIPEKHFEEYRTGKMHAPIDWYAG